MKKKIFQLLFFTCFCSLIFASFNIARYFFDLSSTNTQIEELSNEAEVSYSEDTDQTEIIETLEELAEDNPYWSFIKQGLINVNFNNLSSINADTRGWIEVPGTNINYPFVQTSDNDYYLTHSFNKSNNSAGWVFADYRNDLTNIFEKNTIIYAHGRLDGTMFGSLKNTLGQDWLNNQENHFVRLATKTESSIWQVFSVYTIPTISDYLRIDFDTEKQFLSFANTLQQRSVHDFRAKIESTDKILTLSTCYNQSDKLVLHAKLIKREARSDS